MHSWLAEFENDGAITAFAAFPDCFIRCIKLRKNPLTQKIQKFTLGIVLRIEPRNGLLTTINKGT
jgi:hypothetical protein